MNDNLNIDDRFSGRFDDKRVEEAEDRISDWQEGWRPDGFHKEALLVGVIDADVELNGLPDAYGSRN